MALSENKYFVSFTTGSLLRNESLRLAELFQSLFDWKAVYDKAILENLLQLRTLNTQKRLCSEIISRLRTLNSDELTYLNSTNSVEQGFILWLAICRRYNFIADFAVEVIRERFVTLKNDVNYEDFDAFFNKKSEWHPELEKIGPTTKNKLRQVLFRMLKEAGIITEGNIINVVMLSPAFLSALQQTRRQDILFFPMFETDFRDIK